MGLGQPHCSISPTCVSLQTLIKSSWPRKPCLASVATTYRYPGPIVTLHKASAAALVGFQTSKRLDCPLLTGPPSAVVIPFHTQSTHQPPCAQSDHYICALLPSTEPHTTENCLSAVSCPNRVLSVNAIAVCFLFANGHKAAQTRSLWHPYYPIISRLTPRQQHAKASGDCPKTDCTLSASAAQA
jgi:hypothetical protein